MTDRCVKEIMPPQLIHNYEYDVETDTKHMCDEDDTFDACTLNNQCISQFAKNLSPVDATYSYDELLIFENQE